MYHIYMYYIYSIYIYVCMYIYIILMGKYMVETLGSLPPGCDKRNPAKKNSNRWVGPEMVVN